MKPACAELKREAKMRGRLRRAALAWLIVLVASYSLAACHSLEVPLAGASMKSGDLEIVHMSAKDAAHFRAGMRAYLSALYSITVMRPLASVI